MKLQDNSTINILAHNFKRTIVIANTTVPKDVLMSVITDLHIKETPFLEGTLVVNSQELVNTKDDRVVFIKFLKSVENLAYINYNEQLNTYELIKTNSIDPADEFLKDVKDYFKDLLDKTNKKLNQLQKD